MNGHDMNFYSHLIKKKTVIYIHWLHTETFVAQANLELLISWSSPLQHAYQHAA